MKTNLIGISGKIGSGKDTVGKIIQWLLAHPSLQEIESMETWLEADEINGRAYLWKNKKYADKLKDIVCMLIGCTRGQLESQEFKNTPLGKEWKNMTPRDLLQQIGTNLFREHISSEVWVNALFADYTPESKFIITDVRFPNELQAIKDRGGITIRVEREGVKLKDFFQLKNRDGSITNATIHLSETALDDAEFDYVIQNDGSVEELIEKVKEILKLL